MLVWRIATQRYWRFDGAGARPAGGRWNSPGFGVVYTSATVSLAALELLAHVSEKRAVRNLIVIAAEIPDATRVGQVKPLDLPRNWRESPGPEKLQHIGNDWVLKGATAVLAVPSAVIPQELNYLLNPAHPEFTQIRIREPEPFSLDSRVWK